MTSTATLERAYRAPEVCDLTGLSYRMVDYYARTELVVPSIREAAGSGTARLYSQDDVRRLIAIQTLANAGVSIKTIRSYGIDGTIRRLEQVIELLA